MSTVVCPSCNTPATAGAVFCDNCGYDLRNAAAAPVPATPTPVAPPVPQVGGGITCLSCGNVNIAGASFCENCGAQLGQAHAVTPPVVTPAVIPPPGVQTPSPSVQPPQISPVVFVTGRLVIQGSNATIQIPTGKQTVIVGREDPVSGIFPEIDLEAHDGMNAGVGRQHAKITAQGGQILLEDLGSVNGTFINKQKVLPSQPKPLNNGDELRFGKLVINYYSS